MNRHVFLAFVVAGLACSTLDRRYPNGIGASDNGDVVSAQNYGYVVALFDNGKKSSQWCAGTLLDVSGIDHKAQGLWVVSAAHCGDEPDLAVAAQSNPKAHLKDAAKVEKRYFHPRFTGCLDAAYDIALYKLSKMPGSATSALALSQKPVTLFGRKQPDEEELESLHTPSAWSTLDCSTFWGKTYDASGAECRVTQNVQGMAAWVTGGDSGGAAVTSDGRLAGVILASNVGVKESQPAIAVVRGIDSEVAEWISGCVKDPAACKSSKPKTCNAYLFARTEASWRGQ